ncbi:hypothetical protein [Staphylococcus succinus]|uniref:hypothetical protein n=1 Tax=Staphylococcus succinus TaxID=61015 RepID=UPI001C040318|nr:hypothetical protein [Staphylococcus succinus]MBU0439062.1 hypothetical protein [Staphylococcus succinus]
MDSEFKKQEENEDGQKENDKELKGKNLHFIYVTIILGLTIIMMGCSIYYQNDSSWLFLSFAGTAISVVLSVLAIFVTFIDLAGQQQKLSDITKTSNELKFTLNQFITESQKFYDRMEYEQIKKELPNNDSNEEHTFSDKTDDKQETSSGYGAIVGTTGNVKLKKFQISENDIRAAAEVSGVEIRHISTSLYLYDVYYHADFSKGADLEKFKRLISTRAEILE